MRWAALGLVTSALAIAACGGPLAADELEPSTRLLEFGDVPVGEQREVIVTLRNLSDRPIERLTLRMLTDFDAPLYFTFTPPAEPPLVIPPNGSLDLPIQYRPRDETRHGAAIFIVTPAPEDPGVLIHLRGTGTSNAAGSDGGTMSQLDGGNQGG